LGFFAQYTAIVQTMRACLYNSVSYFIIFMINSGNIYYSIFLVCLLTAIYSFKIKFFVKYRYT